MEKFQVALSRVLQVSYLAFHFLPLASDLSLICLLTLEIGSQGSSQSGPVLSPSEVLIAIHSIDPARDGIPLKQVYLDHFLETCSKRRIALHRFINTFLSGHRCMQYLFCTEADIHSTGFSRRSESTGTITISIFSHIQNLISLNIDIQISVSFFFPNIFPHWRVSGCRSSKFRCQCYSCVQFYKLLVLFRLW